jgi:hypothetical protein
MLLRLQVVRVCQVGLMAGLLVMGGPVEFGCLPVVASRLCIVLRCCVVVLCSWQGNRKIRLLGVAPISNGNLYFSRHDTSLLRLNGYGKLTSPDNSINLLPPLYDEVIFPSVQ